MGTLCVALIAQYAFTSLDLGWHLRTVFSSVAEALSADLPPKPTVTPIGRTERDINEQQRQSAERLATHVSRERTDAPALQPDDVRRAAPESVLQEDLVMRCGEKLPPESAWVTRDVSIHVKSHYQGERGGQHSWRYSVRFENTGGDTVQMLSRHWIFVDAAGAAHEMKGPGARGVTPVLAPGDAWSYESGTSLGTPTGAPPLPMRRRQCATAHTHGRL
jgi:ApaG protein